MRVTETELRGVLVIEPQVHRDSRGYFLEAFHVGKLEAHGISFRPAQVNQSRSTHRTLRGLHWQWRRPQAKIVRALNGEIFDVVVDIRRGSPSFGRWVAVHLTGDNGRQTFVPEGFAHGFCVLSETADVEYLCSDVYDPEGESGLAWDDPVVGVAWPISAPILSERDTRHPPLHASRADLPAYSEVLPAWSHRPGQGA